MEIKNKIIVITGGAGGIGEAITSELLNNGIKFVAVFDLDNDNTKKVIQKLKKDHREKIDFFPCDVTNKNQFADNLDKVVKIHKTIDILINNAGIGGDVRAELLIEVNYKALVLTSLLFIDRFGKHKGGQGGTIINLGSIAGLSIQNSAPVYCSTKHAVISFTRCLDMKQYAVTGVRVIAVCPGATDTPILSNIVKHPLDFIFGTADDLANYHIQKPVNVANAVVQIIQKGKSGDVWVSENDKAPYKTEVGSYRI